jgi:hypothetical protein
MNQKPNPHTLNGGESPDSIETMFSSWGPVHYICGVRIADDVDCRRTLDLDATLPAFSTVSTEEIDQVLEGVGK